MASSLKRFILTFDIINWFIWNRDITFHIWTHTTLISLSIHFTTIVIEQKIFKCPQTLSTCNSSFFHYIQLKKYFTLFINGRLFFIWFSHFSLNAHSGYLTVIRMVACQWQSLSTQCINSQEQELTKNSCFYLKFMTWMVSKIRQYYYEIDYFLYIFL